MSDSTSINDLPSDPAGGSQNANVQISISENSQKQSTPLTNNNLTLDPITINQIVTGIQQASSSGATMLPSRDIPINTSTIAQDPHVQPNYVPPAPQRDYIADAASQQDVIQGYYRDKERSDNLDDLYSEIQTPLLLGALYFLFQLPFFRKMLLSYFPVLFNLDGNFNINGYLFMSVLFGLIYYMCNKLTSQFSTF
jgi:hypothetical protein